MISVDAQRSRNMARIRSGNTKPEKVVRSLLHKIGYRFRLHRRDLPGTPDIVLPKYRSVIMVHGCFWHQHKGCKGGHIPKSNREYWLPKLTRNEHRDAEAKEALALLGWKVLTVWECETANTDALKKKIRRFLSA